MHPRPFLHGLLPSSLHPIGCLPLQQRMVLAQHEGERGQLVVKRSSLWVGFLILKVWGDCISLRTSCPLMLPSHLSPAPSGPPAPGSRPAAPSFYTVLRLAPGGLRSGRPPLQPRMQLEERGFQRGDFSLWLRPARRADAGEYRAIVSLRDRAAVRSRDHALSCRLHLRVGQASSRWGQDKGRRARRRPPGSPPPRGRKGWAEAVLLRMHPRPAREPPEG